MFTLLLARSIRPICPIDDAYAIKSHDLILVEYGAPTPEFDHMTSIAQRGRVHPENMEFLLGGVNVASVLIDILLLWLFVSVHTVGVVTAYVSVLVFC